MKRFFQVIIVLGISLNGFSQIKQGTMTFGGDTYGNYYSIEIDEEEPVKYIDIGLNPIVGIFIVDNFELRLSQLYSYSQTSLSSIIKENNVAIRFNAIKYFGDKSLKPFIGLSFQSGFEWRKIETTSNFRSISNLNGTYSDLNGTYENKWTTIKNQGAVVLGFAYFIYDYISVNPSLEYTYLISNYNFKQTNSTDNKSRIKRKSLYFKLGLGFYF